MAVAVRYILSEPVNETRISRVAVIHTDLHQGNGTAHIFQDDPSVFTFSIHQENNYPVKQKSSLDIGLPDSTADAEYLFQLKTAIRTIFSTFKPEMVIYVAGVDPYKNDQLGGLGISIEGIRERDRLVFEACMNHDASVAAVLAGGYAHDVADTVLLHANTYRAMREIFEG